MNALDLSLQQALKRRVPPAPVSPSPQPTILKVNLRLFGPARDAKGRFIKQNR